MSDYCDVWNEFVSESRISVSQNRKIKAQKYGVNIMPYFKTKKKAL